MQLSSEICCLKRFKLVKIKFLSLNQFFLKFLLVFIAILVFEVVEEYVSWLKQFLWSKIKALK